MRALPTLRPIILSWVEQEVRVMERAPGGVAAAVAEPGLEGAGSVDIPSLSPWWLNWLAARYIIYNIQFMEGGQNRKNSRGGAPQNNQVVLWGGLLGGGPRSRGPGG